MLGPRPDHRVLLHAMPTSSPFPLGAVVSAASDRIRAGRGRHRGCCSEQSRLGLGHTLLSASCGPWEDCSRFCPSCPLPPPPPAPV